MDKLTISELAKQARVNVETIRFYERRGLIPEPPRNTSGYRQYSLDDLKRTLFILRAKRLGFSLNEILELLSLKVEAGVTCGDVKGRVDAKISDVENRIEALVHMKTVLSRLSNMCTGLGPVSECPILEALDKER